MPATETRVITKFLRERPDDSYTIEAALENGAYQAIDLRSRKKPPVGPPSGSVANQTAVSAPSATERSASGEPVPFRTQPGSTELTNTPLAMSSALRMRVIPLRANFDRR